MNLLSKSQSFVPSPLMEDEAASMPARILVVEDEILIRMMVAETLNDAGYQVSEAASAKSALETIAADEALRCVILDVGLPDANGEVLIDKIRALRAFMPIIVTTGYDTNELRRKSQSDPLLRILTKPYQPEMLNAILSEWGIVV